MINKAIRGMLIAVSAVLLTPGLAIVSDTKKNNPPPKPAPAVKPPPKTTVKPPTKVVVPPPPPGQKPPPPPPPHVKEGKVYRQHVGDQEKPLVGGWKEYRSPNGQKVITNSRGEVRRIEAPRGFAGTDKMVISRGPRGGRTVVTGHPGTRTVSYGPNRGFVERPIPSRPGYISRTYVGGGHSYAHVYREYRFNNRAYYRYVPGRYYGHRFYEWARTPWAVHAHYGWFGLATPAPWNVYYRGYFTPYPDYASPDMWLTDYVIAENMRLSYENEQAAYGDQPPPPPADTGTPSPALSPEVKAAIAEEVRQQLAAEETAAANPEPANPQSTPSSERVPDALNPANRVFIVSNNLDLTTVGCGEACSLSPGDM